MENYYAVQQLPSLLLPFFTSGEEPSSEHRVTAISDSIEQSLERSGITEARPKIEAVTRKWLAFHIELGPVSLGESALIEQGGADQPATASVPESEDSSEHQPESQGPSQ